MSGLAIPTATGPFVENIYLLSSCSKRRRNKHIEWAAFYLEPGSHTQRRTYTQD
jgi:hypothetical protein